VKRERAKISTTLSFRHNHPPTASERKGDVRMKRKEKEQGKGKGKGKGKKRENCFLK